MSISTPRFRFPNAAFLSFSLLAASLATSIALPEIANAATARDRYVEVKAVNGTVTSGGRPVQVGDRLQIDGPGINTSDDSSAMLAIDDGIGTVEVTDNTKLQVQGLNVLSDGSKTTQLYLAQGQAKAKIRSFTNKNSSLTIGTPSGVAGVRGTEFGVVVLPNGEMRVATLSGTVEVVAQNKTEILEGGFSSIIFPGQAPTVARRTEENVELSLELLAGADAGRIRVMGMVNPVNFVFLNGQPIVLGQDGQLNTVVPIPDDRRLRLVVRNPWGKEQVYELKVPESLQLN